jgi:hypothetical protein
MTTKTATGIWRFLTGNPEANIVDGYEKVFDWIVEHTPAEEEALFDVLMVRTHEALQSFKRFGDGALDFNMKLSLNPCLVLFFDTKGPFPNPGLHTHGFEGVIEVNQEHGGEKVGKRPFFLAMKDEKICGIYAKPLAL